jgi:anthranilate 1,2-dioxygenase small subunit
VNPVPVSFELRFEIEALYGRYARSLNKGPIEEWPALFVEEGRYRAVTAENMARGWPLALMLCETRAAIEDRVHAIANLSMTIPRHIRHLITGIRIGNESNASWAVEANFAVFETVEGQQQTVCFAAGEYRDVVTRDTDGQIKFLEKLSISDTTLIRNSLVFPL